MNSAPTSVLKAGTPHVERKIRPITGNNLKTVNDRSCTLAFDWHQNW